MSWSFGHVWTSLVIAMTHSWHVVYWRCGVWTWCWQDRQIHVAKSTCIDIVTVQ